MTVTTLEPIAFEQIVEDAELPCCRKACSSGQSARWIIRARHNNGCTNLYCDPCHEGLLAFAATPGLKLIWCGKHDLDEWFRDLSEVIASMERL